ncbi:hypothetical protein LPAF129_17510 [Ligilactobacillus pabuli]|uniref:DUF3862 domain-containing protein n=1 Tax=Ligilactobacillus pabuli TaxID=2886039 RepID=A0ABQ5JN03_9LACO|nr:DUF3862 domain-containing protein [Ligilactobacillus pabuli]GKS82065.1 hypothetical protein LPAF129_17510 [Ligilactobacillus pabuli]HIW88624.1 DUF3862 domain-containing protein [Candidatus Ligilactobacillus excrementipullorum]
MTEKRQNTPQPTSQPSLWPHAVSAVLLLIVVILAGVLLRQNYQAKSHLTQANFNSIELSRFEGDSLQDVSELFGSRPKKVTQTQKKGVKTQVAVWQQVANSPAESRIYVFFDDGHAVSKTIQGLKRGRTKTITRQNFMNLKLGTKKGDIARKLGTPNDYTFNERLPGLNNEQWTYTAAETKGEPAGVLTLSFRNGRLAAKTQNNLK